MSTTPRHRLGPPAPLAWGVGLATTMVVVLAFGQLTAEVVSLGKPWGPLVVRYVIIGGFWLFMLYAYARASRIAVLERRWWLFTKALGLILGAMAVAVLYRMFVNVHSW